jgi:hypothetical protein
MAEESSRLLVNSKAYWTCSIAKNGDGYVPGQEYNLDSADTISDGDCRGRDPKNAGGSIGTNKDIDMRNCLMAKNSDGYTYGNEYCEGNVDTISDGDCKGRDPQSEGSSIGTNKDIEMRNCLMAKNKCNGGYSYGNEYCSGNVDTISDGDDKGRDPKNAGGSIGTNIDIKERNELVKKNMYTYGKEYCSA